MSICLSNDEIYDLTHRKKYSAQRRALNKMGVDFKVRPDGTVAVLRELAFSSPMRKPKRIEPNFDAVR